MNREIQTGGSGYRQSNGSAAWYSNIDSGAVEYHRSRLWRDRLVISVHQPIVGFVLFQVNDVVPVPVFRPALVTDKVVHRRHQLSMPGLKGSAQAVNEVNRRIMDFGHTIWVKKNLVRDRHLRLRVVKDDIFIVYVPFHSHLAALEHPSSGQIYRMNGHTAKEQDDCQ